MTTNKKEYSFIFWSMFAIIVPILFSFIKINPTVSFSIVITYFITVFCLFEYWLSVISKNNNEVNRMKGLILLVIFVIAYFGLANNLSDVLKSTATATIKNTLFYSSISRIAIYAIFAIASFIVLSSTLVLVVLSNKYLMNAIITTFNKFTNLVIKFKSFIINFINLIKTKWLDSLVVVKTKINNFKLIKSSLVKDDLLINFKKTTCPLPILI